MAEEFAEARFETVDGLSLHYRDYDRAPPGAPSGATPVLCLPGLTRNSRDFGPLAAILAPTRRVLCLDMRGRGRSDPDPDGAGYNPVTETGDALALIERLGLGPVVIVGTSRGGISAMLAAVMRPEALAGAVLNDIGPEIGRAGLRRIAASLGPEPESHPDWEAAAAALAAANADQFPAFGAADWAAMARRLYVEIDGRPTRDYDQGLAEATAAAFDAEPPTLWDQFDALARTPLLAIRGARSDILSAETFDAMAARAPAMRRVSLPGRGHAPTLDEPEAVAAILELLRAVDAR